MGWLNTEKPPDKWSGSYFKQFVERVRTAVNYIDSNNFPDGLSGLLLNKKSVPLSALNGIEFNQTLIALATAHSVTATSATNVGGFFLWDAMWDANAVSVKLEIVGGSANAAASAVFELHGTAGKLVEVSSNKGAIEWLRSAEFTPPAESQTLTLKMRTTNGSHAALILTARLIIGLK